MTKIQSNPRRRELTREMRDFDIRPNQERIQTQEKLLIELLRILDLEITHWARDWKEVLCRIWVFIRWQQLHSRQV
jgi:hypothetical protein